MTSVIFDPDARTEFLASVKYYQDCQHGLMNRFRRAIESATENIQESPFRYHVLHAPFSRKEVAQLENDEPFYTA